MTHERHLERWAFGLIITAILIHALFTYLIWQNQEDRANQLSHALNTLAERLETEREERATNDDILLNRLGQVNNTLQQTRSESQQQAAVLSSELGTLRDTQAEQIKDLEEKIVLNVKSSDFQRLITVSVRSSSEGG